MTKTVFFKYIVMNLDSIIAKSAFFGLYQLELDVYYPKMVFNDIN